MDKENIKREILNIAAQIFEVDVNLLNLESSTQTMEQWDSLAHLRLLMEIQGTFEITFTTSEIQDLKCLNEIYLAVLKRGTKDENPYLN